MQKEISQPNEYISAACPLFTLPGSGPGPALTDRFRRHAMPGYLHTAVRLPALTDRFRRHAGVHTAVRLPLHICISVYSASNLIRPRSSGPRLEAQGHAFAGSQRVS
jgi:hypothetical protein